jgi:putative endonuclease
MTCFVYVLGSSSDLARGGVYRTYVGWTNDLARRLDAHNTGSGARSTRGRVWVLLYAEAYVNRGEAMSREWHIKRDKKFRKRLSEGQRGEP